MFGYSRKIFLHGCQGKVCEGETAEVTVCIVQHLWNQSIRSMDPQWCRAWKSTATNEGKPCQILERLWQERDRKTSVVTGSDVYAVKILHQSIWTKRAWKWCTRHSYKNCWNTRAPENFKPSFDIMLTTRVWRWSCGSFDRLNPPNKTRADEGQLFPQLYVHNKALSMKLHRYEKVQCAFPKAEEGKKEVIFCICNSFIKLFGLCFNPSGSEVNTSVLSQCLTAFYVAVFTHVPTNFHVMCLCFCCLVSWWEIFWMSQNCDDFTQ